MIFCLKGNEIYVLYGFVKKTQRTPQQDLALAQRRMKDISK